MGIWIGTLGVSEQQRQPVINTHCSHSKDLLAKQMPPWVVDSGAVCLTVELILKMPNNNVSCQTGTGRASSPQKRYKKKKGL